MKKMIKKQILQLVLFQEKFLNDIFKKIPLRQTDNTQSLIQKYKNHFLIIIVLVLLSLVSEALPEFLRGKPQALSLDNFVPKDFVLMPIEITNGRDIIDIIGSHGVVDLYAYSKQTGLPEKQAAKAVKILPPNEEEGHFMILVPEKEAIYLFEYSEPFYALIQNPRKTGSKIYKKSKKKSILVIEESF